MGGESTMVRLCHELKSADVVGRLLALLDAPAHLHKRRHCHRGIRDRKVATDKHGGLQRERTKDANTAVAEIMDATIKFLWRRARRGTRWKQAARVHIEHLREACKLAPFAIGEIIHKLRSCTKIAPG